MLLLVLMLQSVTQPPVTISHVRMSPRPISRRLSLMPGCRLDVRCGTDPTDPDRLIADTVLPEDPKQAALRGTWQNCGITGMPVCPKRGREVLRASLGE